MGILSDIFGKSKQFTIREESYEVEKVGKLSTPLTLDEKNAFLLSNTVAEIYNPIDFLADRGSKLSFTIQDKSGKDIQSTEVTRLLNEINPFYSFSDLFYQAIFSYLSDGNIYGYTTASNVFSNNQSYQSVQRLDILLPSLIEIKEYNNVSLLSTNSYSNIIKEVRYKDTAQYTRPLDTNSLKIKRYDSIIRSDSNFLCKSPLFKAERSINNLLACYSARYNVYVNNGSAGYIAKKGTANGIESAVNGDREDILNDINARNGIVGNKNIWGISSVPIEFVNTLVDIQKLMPFDETLEDAIKIASVFQLPPNLATRKDQSTFNNQETTERSVWENTLMSIVDLMCGYFSDILYLTKSGLNIKAGYKSVSALQPNESIKQDIITKKIQNLQAIQAILPSYNVQEQIDKIIQEYE